MDEITIVTPTGCIGNRGTHKETFQKVMEEEHPDAVASDAGSLDCGPWYLGTGKPHSPVKNIRWDLDLLVSDCVPKKIPIIIGSAGGSGAGPHVEFTVNIVREIAEKRGLNFRLAVITSDVDKGYLIKRAETEQIPGLDGNGMLTLNDVESCTTIVAMMGAEPILKALDAGADVIIAGRATDNGTIAAYPIWRGADKGLALHMGDIMECGESALVETKTLLRGLGPNRIPVVGKIAQDYFKIKAGHPYLSCTPQSAAAHSLYERSSIYSS
ncbi:MAG: acyclic terpene utilization AtuA family protein, partial [Candidatus Hodarchaeota archaeon]